MRRLFSSTIACNGTSLRRLSYHKDYFALFGISRDVKVDLDALKKSYHGFQAQHHPDLHQGAVSSGEASPIVTSSSSGEVVNLKDASAYASNAYTVLKDPFQRCRYLRLLLEADVKAVVNKDKALLPTGKEYYQLVVTHDATENQQKEKNSVAETVRSEDHEANPVNNDQEFLMEMMELNMKLSEAMEYEEGNATRRKELDELKVAVTELERDYAAKCEQLYGRIASLQKEILEGGASGSAADVFVAAKTQFRDQVSKWTYASNLRRQINDAY